MRCVGLGFHGIPSRGTGPSTSAETPYWVDRERFEWVLDRVAQTPGRYVLTFDDANRSDIEIALPELCARGLSARFFVPVGNIGRPGFLSRDDVRALSDAGMTVGSHGMDHVRWATLDDSDLAYEVVESRCILEDIIGGDVLMAGIPFGVYDSRVLKCLRRAGYRIAMSADRGGMSPDAFLQPRNSLRSDMRRDEVEAVLASRMGWLRYSRRALSMGKRRFVPSLAKMSWRRRKCRSKALKR